MIVYIDTDVRTYYIHNTYINTHTHTYIGGSLENFVDSPYYYESELRGGAVTVSFSKYLPW
jgi:hypothetical protein